MGGKLKKRMRKLLQRFMVNMSFNISFHFWNEIYIIKFRMRICFWKKSIKLTYVSLKLNFFDTQRLEYPTKQGGFTVENKPINKTRLKQTPLDFQIVVQHNSAINKSSQVHNSLRLKTSSNNRPISKRSTFSKVR